MTPEEELLAFRESQKVKDRELLLRARKTATTFAVIAVILLIGLNYIFLTQTQANEARVMVEYKTFEAKRITELAAEELKACGEEIEQVKKSLQACKGR